MAATRKQKKIFQSAEALARHLGPVRARGKKLVTTNGCFDIIHAGHVQYLYEAKSFGDILAVGINADETVRRLKGPGRPIQSARERCLIVSALEMVDAVFIFPEPDPVAFLETLKPDVHVKGGDYTADIIEKAAVEHNGGVVKIVGVFPDRSTSGIVRKIHAMR